MCCLYVACLCSLVAAAQQKYERLPDLTDVQPVPWAAIDTQFDDAPPDWSPVAHESDRQAINPCDDPGTGLRITKARQPIAERNSPLGGTVLAYFDAGHCSLLATRGK
jgi:hypothetical protein